MGLFGLQTSFNYGELSDLLIGRSELEKYDKGVALMENFIPLAHGPATFAPGTKFIAKPKHQDKDAVFVRFVYSTSISYMLEFGDKYIRFFRDQAQVQVAYSAWLTGTFYVVGRLVTNGVNHYRCISAHTSGTFATDLGDDLWEATEGATDLAYEIASPYTEEQVRTVKYCQSADVIYLFHPAVPPQRLARAANTTWTIAPVNFAPPPLTEISVKPATTLTPAATTGSGITFTAGDATWIAGDVGRVITYQASKASIVGYVSTTQVLCDIIDDFTSTSAMASGSWRLSGSPTAELVPSAKKPVGKVIEITAEGGDLAMTNLLEMDENHWDESGVHAGVYYLKNTAPFYQATKPDRVYINGERAKNGFLALLGIDQWAFGNVDGLGYNTIYIRLSDETDPDSKSVSPTADNDYVQAAAYSSSTSVFRSTDVGKYMSILGGMVKITSFVNTGKVKALIIRELVDADRDYKWQQFDSTSAWAIQVPIWNSTNGYPSCGCFYEDRLVTAGVPAYPGNTRGSMVGDYHNFTEGVNDGDAFNFTIGGRRINHIQWIEPREFLLLGTSGGEWKLGPEDTGEPLTPLNVVAREYTTSGTLPIMPVTVGNCTLFVQRAGRKILEFTANQQSFTAEYVAPDLTLLAEHVTKGSIVKMCYQQEPYSIVWACLGNGNLVGMTYLRDQDVVGWFRRTLDGYVDDIESLPTTTNDELWLMTRRFINGVETRLIEVQANYFTDDNDTFKNNKGLNAHFLDAGGFYNGQLATTITCGSYLDGQLVHVVTDGGYCCQKTVTNGIITLDHPAYVVHYGLPYFGSIKTLRPRIGLRDGTAQGRVKKINSLVMRVINTSVFKAGRDNDHLDDAIYRDSEEPMGSVSLTTGDILVPFEGGLDRDATICIRQDKPLPCTIASIMPEYEVYS